MKRNVRLLFIIIAAPFAVLSLCAAEKPTALFLLDAEPGLRLSSMGNVFSSVSAEDAFYHPWALGWAVNPGVSFAQWPDIIEGAKYSFAGGMMPLGKRGGLSIGYLRYATPEETIEEFDGATRSIALEDDQLIDAGCGIRLSETIFAGVNVKYLTSTLAGDYKATSLLSDFGLQYTSLSDKHSGGIAIKNIGQELTYYKTSEPLPRVLVFGYSYLVKPVPNHRLTLGGAYSQVLNSGGRAFSAGVEYVPGIQFLSLRAGARLSDGSLEYNGGLGVNFGNLDVGAGYSGAMGGNNFTQDSSPMRFSVSWLFGPRDDYSRGEAYLKRGMDAKAIALWDQVLPHEKNYAKSQDSLKLRIDPPQLTLAAHLKTPKNNGLLSSGETGTLVITISNKGKSRAVDISNELVVSDHGNAVKCLDIDKTAVYGKIRSIEPNGQSVLEIPVKADDSVSNGSFGLVFRTREGRGFNPEPLKISIGTKTSLPQPLLARYTFREDNSGNSVGNGNGIIEKGEQVEVTGYIVNAGDKTAHNLVAELVSSSPGFHVLPELSKTGSMELKGGDYKKVVFAFAVSSFNVGADLSAPYPYNVSHDLESDDSRVPIVIKFSDQQGAVKTQPLEIACGKFYQDSIEPLFPDIDLSPMIIAALPKLSGPIPGARAQEIICSKTGRPPALEYEIKLTADDNKNGLYEPNENLRLIVSIRNTGEGAAEGVKVRLSGDPTLVSLLGSGADVGVVQPGSRQQVDLSAVIPKNIPRKEAAVTVQVTESRGYSPRVTREIRASFMPEEIQVVRELPKLEPCPRANRNAHPNAGALVIGISDYRKMDKLRFAVDDAKVAAEYIDGVLGIPKGNIKVLCDADATKSMIDATVKEWLVKRNFDYLVVYYAGHGTPDPEDQASGSPYLIPYDGDLDMKGTLISLNELSQSLAESRAKDILVLVDACFSGGGGRTPKKLAQRGIAVMPRFVENRVVMFSASSGRQPSLEFEKAGHGYFTYYTLLGLKGAADADHDGIVTLNELYEYVAGSLNAELEGRQTPAMTGADPKMTKRILSGRYK